MSYYRKKPIIVEAQQWFPGRNIACVQRIPPTKVKIPERGIEVDRPERHVINTPEGQFDVTPGDYIVTGIQGEKYPVKPSIFGNTYEPVIFDNRILKNYYNWPAVVGLLMLTLCAAAVLTCAVYAVRYYL